MQRTADVIVMNDTGGIITFAKAGEVTVEDDGTFSGKIFENEELVLPDRISESTQPFVLSLIFMNDPIRYSSIEN